MRGCSAAERVAAAGYVGRSARVNAADKARTIKTAPVRVLICLSTPLSFSTLPPPLSNTSDSASARLSSSPLLVEARAPALIEAREVERGGVARRRRSRCRRRGFAPHGGARRLSRPQARREEAEADERDEEQSEDRSGQRDPLSPKRARVARLISRTRVAHQPAPPGARDVTHRADELGRRLVPRHRELQRAPPPQQFPLRRATGRALREVQARGARGIGRQLAVSVEIEHFTKLFAVHFSTP